MKLNRGVLTLVAMFGVMAATGCKKPEDPAPAGDPAQTPRGGDPAQAGAPGTDDPTAQGDGSDDRGPRRARKHKGRHGGGGRRWHGGPRRQWGGDPAQGSADPGATPEQ